ncbi:hypothetical protein HNR25_005189 [Streptomonospora salina]|uniref:Uncharacterized protein n=1 Tax=Streptomonospora salina TaxID=104205 RepID=A0A841EKP5_9ACTN|nr:hypothetical protein [Streptomonospora salina]MBB6001358.1 hypothetical protein [Streptomonospora salina]
MSVPLSDLLTAQAPEADRIGTPEVLIDPALPHVPPDQRDQAAATARDVAGEVLHARGALPAQSLARVTARPGWWGAWARVLCTSRYATTRLLTAAAVLAALAAATGATWPQIGASAALGVALSSVIDAWRQDRLQRATARDIEDEAGRLLARAGLDDVLPTP